MGLGHGRAPQTRSSAIPWPGLPRGWGPPTGSPTAHFDATLRRFDMFGGSNDLKILRNKEIGIATGRKRATIQELHRSDFDAPRKAPKTKRYAHKRAKRRRMAEPRAPPTGELGYGARPWPSPADTELGHPMAGPPQGLGTPHGVPDSPFRRYPSTF